MGNTNTPSVIWTNGMRAHLHDELLDHLSRFQTNLQEDPTQLYVFEPLPPVEYTALASEVYCHAYFLHNLCDQRRFPDWPVHDPVALVSVCTRHVCTRHVCTACVYGMCTCHLRLD